MIALTRHAEERAREMGVEMPEILSVARSPLIDRPSPPHHGPGRRLLVGENIVLVVTADRERVITILWNRPATGFVRGEDA